MKTFLLSLVLAASAMAQLVTPGIFTDTKSTSAGETIEIFVTEPIAFEYISYVQVLMYQDPIVPLSVANSCSIYAETGVYGIKQIWLSKANQAGWFDPKPYGTLDLNNGTCHLTKASFDKTSTTGGKLTLELSYPGTKPPIVYFIAPRLSDMKVSLTRYRPACPPHAEPGQFAQFGCPQ